MKPREPTESQQRDVAFGWTANIAGRNWEPKGDGTYVRALRPGQRVPRDTHAITPHPHRGDGWRLCWVFLDALIGVMVGLIVWGAM